MVAGAPDHHFADYRTVDCAGWIFGPGSIHLYPFLINMRKKHWETLLVITVFLLLLGRMKHSWNYVYVALALAAAGICSRWFLEKLHYCWMKLAEALGFVSSKILLTLVFAGVVIPLSTLAKWRGRLHIRLKASPGSYYTERNHTYSSKDFEHPW